jgi:hypothetical protein
LCLTQSSTASGGWKIDPFCLKIQKHSSPNLLKTLGMDFYVNLDRAGYRVRTRRARKTRVGVQHKVTKEDAIKW